MTDESTIRTPLRRYAGVLLGIFALALAVRVLTGNFMLEHLDDPGWFQFGSYAAIERNAVDVLEGRTPAFWIDDPTRTDRMAYPPGQALWIAALYSLTGTRSAAAVVKVQIILDSFAVFLMVGIGVAAFGWRTALIAGFLGALSPLLALVGVTATGDALASWLVLAGIWCLILSAKRQNVKFALAAGFFLGASCWLRVNPLFMTLCWGAALLLFLHTAWRRRLILAGAVLVATLLTIGPVIGRNLYVFYPEVAPTGLNIGWNLLAGIGETERAEEFGAPCCDADMIEQDRAAMGLPADAPLGLTYPDGIKRDRERGRRAVKIMTGHPVWFAGVMARRTASHFKFFGPTPAPVGSHGINVTPSKTLPEGLQHGVLSLLVTVLGMLQSVYRYLALPLTLAGVYFAFRSERLSTWLLLATVGYYVATLAVGHSETRYGLPMQAVLIVFAAVSVSWMIDRLRERRAARGKSDSETYSP